MRIEGALRQVAFRSLAKGSMVEWDFSTALEMTVASPDNQKVRFRTSDGEKKRLVNICLYAASEPYNTGVRAIGYAIGSQ